MLPPLTNCTHKTSTGPSDFATQKRMSAQAPCRLLYTCGWKGKTCSRLQCSYSSAQVQGKSGQPHNWRTFCNCKMLIWFESMRNHAKLTLTAESTSSFKKIRDLYQKYGPAWHLCTRQSKLTNDGKRSCSFIVNPRVISLMPLKWNSLKPRTRRNPIL